MIFQYKALKFEEFEIKEVSKIVKNNSNEPRQNKSFLPMGLYSSTLQLLLDHLTCFILFLTCDSVYPWTVHHKYGSLS